MSLPYDPNDDYGMDDFNIEDYTSRVNFDGEEDQAPYSEAADSAPPEIPESIPRWEGNRRCTRRENTAEKDSPPACVCCAVC